MSRFKKTKKGISHCLGQAVCGSSAGEYFTKDHCQFSVGKEAHSSLCLLRNAAPCRHSGGKACEVKKGMTWGKRMKRKDYLLQSETRNCWAPSCPMM